MSGTPPRDQLRDRLILPVAVAVTALWLVAGFASLLTGDVRVFLIASGPFGGMCGYVFGIRLIRRVDNGTSG